MLELNCTNEQKILVTVNPVTAAGKPAPLDGPIKATIQSGSGDVLVQPDGKSFYVISSDTPDPDGAGTSYLIEGDADVGVGVEPISEIVVLHVSAARAKNFGLSASAPEPK